MKIMEIMKMSRRCSRDHVDNSCTLHQARIRHGLCVRLASEAMAVSLGLGLLRLRGEELPQQLSFFRFQLFDDSLSSFEFRTKFRIVLSKPLDLGDVDHLAEGKAGRVEESVTKR